MYCSYQEADGGCAMPGADMVPLAAGDVVLLDDETRRGIIPVRGHRGGSAARWCCWLNTGPSALFPAISAVRRGRWLTGAGQVDIYKAAHHGSNTRRSAAAWRFSRRTAWSAQAQQLRTPAPLALKTLRITRASVHNAGQLCGGVLY